MTKFNLKLFTAILAVTLVASMIVFYACKKDEKENNSEKENIIMKSSAFFSTNPFDENYSYIRDMYQDIAAFLSKIDENKDYENFELFVRDYQNLIERYKNNNPYQNFDISQYNDTEQRVIQNLIKGYMNNIKEVGLLDASSQIESTISSTLDSRMQQDMYKLVSQLKLSHYYMEDIMEDIIVVLKSKWGERFWACMEAKADATFGDDSNWIDWTQFMIAPPVNLGWWIGSCSWTATFG